MGILNLEIQQKQARLAGLPSPKLVILAGSNGPYSHSCVIIGAMLKLPCENAGIAVGIGLDQIFARYAPALHRGDIVYMPMELQQYATTGAQLNAGADAALLLRHNRALLRRLPAGRGLGALFCCTLDDFLESVLELSFAKAGLYRPQDRLALQYNVAGDRINTPSASASKILLTMPARLPPTAVQIAHGAGAKLIVQFIRTETAQGVTIIGGLPTDFSDADIPPATRAAITALYTGNGAKFLTLPNKSQYPRTDFYDSEDHLSQPYQWLHSHLIGTALKTVLNSQ